VEPEAVDETVVLVHGLAGSSRWWRRVVPALSERFRVHGLDLPRGYTLATAPGLVLRELDHLGIERTHLVGHSLGGLVAARVAARAPERVDRLALVAPAGVGLPRSVLALGLPLARTILTLRPAFVPLLAHDSLRVGPLALLGRAREVLAEDELREELRLVRAPTLLLWGERDRLVPAALAERFLAELPDARVEIVPRAGHVPMEDAPEVVAAALLAHLRPGTAGVWSPT
jgi:pimeloyl-ACP methyl ester carboxylesterase